MKANKKKASLQKTQQADIQAPVKRKSSLNDTGNGASVGVNSPEAAKKGKAPTEAKRKPAASVAKRSAPPVRKKKKKKKGDKYLSPLVAFVAALLVETCMLFPDSVGRIGLLIKELSFGLFGAAGAIALPVAVAVLAFFRNRLMRNRVMGRKIALALLSVLFLASTVQLIGAGIPAADEARSLTTVLWHDGSVGIGGGVVGGAPALLLGRACGRIAATVLSALVFALTLSFALGCTGIGIWQFVLDILCISLPGGKDSEGKAPVSRAPSGGSPLQPTVSGVSLGGIRPSAVGADVVDPFRYGSEFEPVGYTYVRSDKADGGSSGALRPENASGISQVSVGEAGYTPSSVKGASGIGASPSARCLGQSRTQGSNPASGVGSGVNSSAQAGFGYSSGFRAISDEDEAEEPENENESPAVSAGNGDGESGSGFGTYTPVNMSNDAYLPGKGAAIGAALEDIDDEALYEEQDYGFDSDTDGDAEEEDEEEMAGSEYGVERYSSIERVSPPVAAQEPEPAADDGKKYWEQGGKYVLPPTELLNPIKNQSSVSEEEIREVADKLLRKLASFKISARLVGYSIGPSITRYELSPGEGVRVKSISQLLDDLSMELAAEGVRIEAPIPGKAAVGVEVPNKKVSVVSFRSLVESPEFTKAKSKITVCIGLNVTGNPVFMDIDDMPHVLIAGQTKSGKSVAINCMLLSLLFRVSPDEVKLILVDPKRVELNIYGKLPHLVMPVVDDPKRAAAALSWAVKEMERRYDLMERVSARNRDEYRRKTASDPNREDFPQLVIIIDELADLMLQVKEHVEPLINRLAAKARACGIHLLIGTQRPSVDVLTGLIKANIPARIAFKVAEQVDSRTILGNVGAEKLLGRGDMLYQPTGCARTRVQGAFVDGDEISNVVDFIIENNGEARYDPDIMAQIDEEAVAMSRVGKRGAAADDDGGSDRDKKKDPMFYQAVEIAVTNQSIATSALQRYLEIGYGRAAKLIDAMERMGIVGPPNGAKPRDVLMTMEQYQVWRLEQRFEDD